MIDPEPPDVTDAAPGSRDRQPARDTRSRTTTGSMAICLAEDRRYCEVGLRLAVLSVDRHMPGVPVYVYYHSPSPEFETWIRRFPTATLIPERPPAANTWNCKPQALKPILEKGYREVVWLDSDIMVTNNVLSVLEGLGEATLLVTQEPTSLPHQGTRPRTAAWGLPVGREIRFTLNSCVVRVTTAHRKLLERWIELLNDPSYLAAQAIPVEQRPLHMMGDQDVLNALLGSTEFAGVPLRVVRSGSEIIHTGGALGYSVGERLSGVFRPKPAFLHATAGKPWLWLGRKQQIWGSHSKFFAWSRRLLQETSPYLAEARRYRDELGEDSSWLDRRSVLGVLVRLAGFGHFALRGLPITVFATVARTLNSLRN